MRLGDEDEDEDGGLRLREVRKDERKVRALHPTPMTDASRHPEKKKSKEKKKTHTSRNPLCEKSLAVVGGVEIRLVMR
jgi:hypothetical protein